MRISCADHKVDTCISYVLKKRTCEINGIRLQEGGYDGKAGRLSQEHLAQTTARDRDALVRPLRNAELIRRQGLPLRIDGHFQGVEAATIHRVPRWGTELRAGALPLRLQVGDTGTRGVQEADAALGGILAPEVAQSWRAD